MKVTYSDTIRCEDDGPPTVPRSTKVVATELVREGGPMRYRPPKPLDAQEIDRIVREAVRAELATKNSRYWSPERAAVECTVSNRTFAEWLAEGKVRFYKVGRRVLINPTELTEDLTKFRRRKTPKRQMRRQEPRH